MAGNFTPNQIRDTRLWRRLNRPFSTTQSSELAQCFARSLPDFCKIASDRMKLMPVLHGEFTLHDDVHLLRVTELMGLVIPDQVLEGVLNPVEIALLILAAHFHDVGMICDSEESETIRDSSEFKVSREKWIAEQAGFRDVLEKTEGSAAGKDAQILSEFEQGAFVRFVRAVHADRSAEYVSSKLGSKSELVVGTGNLAPSLALLCQSHNWHPDKIAEPHGLFLDKLIGTYPVNLQYLAIILRLADILDFDRERTPDELYKSINFRSPISISEWEKHRQVDGWVVGHGQVRFECECHRPEERL
ncbi:MAG: hypothetical protein AAF585_08005 [Verrucomicrobiota bacterium]